MSDLNHIFQALKRENPAFHGPGGKYHWSLSDDVLQWLFETVAEGQRTLETGCGYSTLIFALKGAEHTVISPVAEEHQRIRSWGEAHGVDFSKVRFVAAKSEDVLPKLGPEPLDIVLIDGWHAFPAPFIDWFFTCSKLAVGGRMIVDDTQILACRVLRDFLEKEAGRWSLECRFNRTDIFRKLQEQMFEGDWREQPWGEMPVLSLRDRFHLHMRPRLALATSKIPRLMPILKKARSLIMNGK